MISLKDILDIFFETLKNCVENITLPTGDTLVPTCFYAAGITVASAICKALGVFSIVCWQGALIATILLAILAYIERREHCELLKLYRSAESSIAAIKKRAKGASAYVKTLHDSDIDGTMQ